MTVRFPPEMMELLEKNIHLLEKNMLVNCERKIKIFEELLTNQGGREDHRRELETYRTMLIKGGLFTLDGLDHIQDRMDLILHFIEQDLG